MFLPFAALLALKTAAPLPHHVFTSSRFSIDRVLQRPYDSAVPFGSSGNRVWATSPQGWAFRDGVHLIYITNLDALDLTLRGRDTVYTVRSATYYPSHVAMQGGPGSVFSATASFTFSGDNVENPLTRPFRPEKRWTCWSSGHRTDSYTVDFGKRRRVRSVDLYFYDDIARGGECAPPESVAVQAYREGAWLPVSAQIASPHPDLNTIQFPSTAAAERLRFTFRNRGLKYYTGLYGVDPHFTDGSAASQRVPLAVSGDKWITQNDVLVARIRVVNRSRSPQPFFARMQSELSGRDGGYADQRSVDGYPLYLDACGADEKQTGTEFLLTLQPGESRTLTFACAVAASPERARARLDTELSTQHPLSAQEAAYQGWFDSNIASFRCSDPWVTKLYYHRWYNIKKNSMNPRLGHLQRRTFSEGRWTSDWYANVISYGAGHQIDESRWLRDPTYAWGHLRTWTDNPRPDGIYPSHVTPAGQQGGQYTDWITSTAWDVNLVHPDRTALSQIVGTLARNVHGWERKYGWGGSPLLVVDSHWWTGMEWQPAFFSFAGYQTGGSPGTSPEYMTPLRRVDLTAYNYGNARAVAKIYRELGEPQKAAPFDALADATRAAVLKQMWDPSAHWFCDLRASDGARSPAKEIVGLYPFTFDLPPAGQGYESAWAVAVDPSKFWTPWPLASTSQDCPAYSQTGWPVGPGGSGCMWNGPTWPHANSLVLTAMANTIRHYSACALTREKMLALFESYTRAQFKNQDIRYPWTGEFYNGDTGQWETDQRDYNHSLWVDPLIRDFVGLVPRPDNVLEIDPLLPEGAWSYWVLDGQAYRGHDVTVAYDANGGHVSPGFRGFAVYLDGRRIYAGPKPIHLRYDMASGRMVTDPPHADAGGPAAPGKGALPEAPRR